MIYLHHLTIKWKLLLMGIHTLSQKALGSEVETLHGSNLSMSLTLQVTSIYM
ncbi:hypothetical protein WP8S18C01_40490 [Aeromonas caviae]|nr:hypothetical protein WP8S18C01_40490 [Aeromonas caviae]